MPGVFDNLTPSDQDLMGQLCRFAERQLNGKLGIYQASMRSATVGADVYLIIGFGEQAHALARIFTEAQQREAASSLIMPGEIDLETLNVKGH